MKTKAETHYMMNRRFVSRKKKGGEGAKVDERHYGMIRRFDRKLTNWVTGAELWPLRILFTKNRAHVIEQHDVRLVLVGSQGS